jgi:hypothetical protein
VEETLLPPELVRSAGKCGECESQFVRGDQLTLHLEKGHGGWTKKVSEEDKDAGLKCYWCEGVTFEGEEERGAHFQDKHKEDKTVI